MQDFQEIWRTCGSLTRSLHKSIKLVRTDVIKFPSELANDMAELQSGSICIKTLYHSRNTGHHKSRSSNLGHNELSSFSQMLHGIESSDSLHPPMCPNEGLRLSHTTRILWCYWCIWSPTINHQPWQGCSKSHIGFCLNHIQSNRTHSCGQTYKAGRTTFST